MNGILKAKTKKKVNVNLKILTLEEKLEQALKENKKLKSIITKMFRYGLDLEKWAHLDKSNTYHIVYTYNYEHLDVPISKEDYDYLGVLYGKQ